MAGVTVKADYQRALARLDLSIDQVKTATFRAINKVATSGRASASKEIRSTGYGIKAAAVKKAISISKATKADLNAIVRAKGRPIPLIAYGARKTQAGVSVNVLHGRKIIRGAFIATMPSGHRGVFVRVDSAAGRALGGSNRKGAHITRGRYRSQDRHGLPIDELFGPSIPAAFKSTAVMDAVTATMRQRFPTVLRQELRFVGLAR